MGRLEPVDCYCNSTYPPACTCQGVSAALIVAAAVRDGGGGGGRSADGGGDDEADDNGGALADDKAKGSSLCLSASAIRKQ